MLRPSNRVRVLFLGFVAGILVSAVQAQEFQKVKFNGVDFVTLESFCAAYAFNSGTISRRGPFELKGPLATIEFESGLRRMRFNGRRMWLSVGLIEDDKGRLLVAELDLDKTLEPLLRPSRIKNLKPVQGVIVDAGHGGKDDGAYGRGVYEKNATLDTAQRLSRILKEGHIPVVMTRSSDSFLELAERADLANKHPDYLFVSVHYNTGPRGSHGVETFAMTPQYAKSTGDEGKRVAGVRDHWLGNGEDSKNILLAWLVHDEMAKLHSPEGDRGVKRARFKVLREIKIPGILVEAGFLTHVADSKIIASQDYREKVAQAIAHAVEVYMGIMDPSRQVAPSPSSEAFDPPSPPQPVAPQVPLREESAPAPADPEAEAAGPEQPGGVQAGEPDPAAQPPEMPPAAAP